MKINTNDIFFIAEKMLNKDLENLSRRKRQRCFEKQRRVRVFLQNAQASIQAREWTGRHAPYSIRQGIAERISGKGRPFDTNFSFVYVPIAQGNIEVLLREKQRGIRCHYFNDSI